MKTFLGISLFLSALSASAADFYRCESIGGTPEYTVEINLAADRAAFFDNDHWAVADRTQTLVIETRPSQVVHDFSGPEVEIRFNQTKRRAYVQGEGASESCVAIPSADQLWSGI
jgi:hypothetical protein